MREDQHYVGEEEKAGVAVDSRQHMKNEDSMQVRTTLTPDACKSLRTDTNY